MMLRALKLMALGAVLLAQTPRPGSYNLTIPNTTVSFEMVSILLLAAIVGALLLSGRAKAAAEVSS